MNLSDTDLAKLSQVQVKPSPLEPCKEPVRRHDRLECALKIFNREDLRKKIRQLYWNELSFMSIFWDAEKREIEFVSDTAVIVITEMV